jgi:hypothetical protein
MASVESQRGEPGFSARGIDLGFGGYREESPTSEIVR